MSIKIFKDRLYRDQLNLNIISELKTIKDKLSDDKLKTDLGVLLIDMLNGKI